MAADKKWYESKTIWNGVLLIVVGVLNAFGIDVPEGALVALLGALGINLRLGDKPIVAKKATP